MSSLPRRRVGYWWSEKKSRKINSSELAEVCRAAGLDLVKLDLDRPFEEQGPFNAIVHKLSDVIVKGKKGDLQSKLICESFQKYVDSHPSMVVIDPLPNIENVLDRYRQYKIVDESEICDKDDIFIPAFVELLSMNVPENLAKMKSAGIEFPIVCKPSMAHGSTLSHQMCLIFNEEGLKDINPPCVVQSFVNHNAVLYKLFVIGNEYFVIERPSLKNFSASERKTIFFDGNEISKPNSSSELTELDDNESYTPMIWPEKEKLDLIVKVLHKRVGLNLLGIDIVVDNRTGHYAIIDTNVFPGYSEADNFYYLLTNLIVKNIEAKESGCQESTFVPTLINHLSTPVLRINAMEKKFNFPLNGLQYSEESSQSQVFTTSECFCCPITGACRNSEKAKNPSEVSRHLNGQILEKPSNQLFQKNGAQEDSGVETSDSCDEKKNKHCHRTVKHQHSKLSTSGCSTVMDSV
ncbi:hypothetical protein JTE90_024043 [Oedothorax gibbosus]|uniref:Inositol-tetrakisphosphate 1-kinase n=1 Tax=Oedothorax gibbosus TaxID=931172 RepID=A0AAV6VAA2_9ARAC|nr:hypothetical protein JTE90_024043 [Oedothorax gibbosus]